MKKCGMGATLLFSVAWVELERSLIHIDYIISIKFQPRQWKCTGEQNAASSSSMAAYLALRSRIDRTAAVRLMTGS